VIGEKTSGGGDKQRQEHLQHMEAYSKTAKQLAVTLKTAAGLAGLYWCRVLQGWIG
jgi:hypothetical protein